MKYLKTSFLVLALQTTLFCQLEFQPPRHADGQMFATEKFEMMEKLSKLRVASSNNKEDYGSLEHAAILRSKNREIQVGDSNETEAELHAVVNPLDPKNIVVGVINIDVTSAIDALNISIYTTFDLGDSWTKSNFSGFEGGVTLGGGDPMFAFDDEGVLYFSWLKFNTTVNLDIGKIGMYASRSNDGGLTWTDLDDPISEYDFTDFVALSDLERFVDKQWMASDHSKDSPYKGNVYISYLSLDVADEVYDIVFKKIEEGSTEFNSTALKVSHDNKLLAQFVNLEVDNKGNIYLVYLSYDDGRMDRSGIYFCMSSDGGESFSLPQLITEFHFPDFGSGRLPIEGVNSARLYPCPQLGVDRSKSDTEGRIYLTFTAYGIDSLESEGTDIYLMHSDDEGKNWTAPMIVNDDLDSSKDQFYSSITVTDEGLPSLAWYDRRNDIANETSTEYYLSYSEDRGGSFEQFSVSSVPSNFEESLDGIMNFGVGEYNEIVTSGNYLIPFWTDGRTNNTELATYAYFYDVNGPSQLEKSVILTEKISVSSPLPNPSKHSFSFDVNVTESTPLKISLYNTEGKMILDIMNKPSFAGSEQIIVNTSELNSGIYLLAITSRQGTQSRKVVIE